MLVGINLLREGLDLPEVSLVAILDADKEGFLRSQSSLIQTVGRAARNVSGRAILYADRMTGSMQRAIDEMDRRRVVQQAFNKEHNIVPTPINKAVSDILQVGEAVEQLHGDGKDHAQSRLENAHLSQAQLMQKIVELDKKMHECVKRLDFEEAASARDEIARLKLLMIRK